MGTKILPTVIQGLKRILKRKQITYRQLAPKINMSESGLKKLFSGKDISFSRLFQICEVLGVQLSDLLSEVERGDNYQHSFTPQQESYFLKNKMGFNIFWKLVYERVSADDVKRHYELGEREFNLILTRLNDLALIKIKSGAVKLPRVRDITWSREGLFAKKLLNDWSTKLLSEQLGAKAHTDGQVQLRYFCFQSHVYKELIEKLKNLEKEFLQNTVRDMNLYEARQLTRVGWLSVAAPTSFVD
jgi:DNA-binding Xre family transcriptional regulator